MLSDDLTAADLAGLLGISERAVNDLARRQIIARAGRGRFAVSQIARYCEHLRSMRAAGNCGPAPVVEERARLLKAQADKAELQVAAARGELLPAADVERRWSDVLRGVRAAMLAVSSRVRQRLPGLTSADVAELDAEIRAALTEAANDE